MLSLKKYSIAVWLFLMVPLVLIAQRGEVSFSGYTDSKQVVSSGYFKVSYSLKNAEGKSFQPPNFKKDFNILNGPSRAMSTSIINGAMSSELTLSYVLRPKSVGKFTIPPAVIYANGKKLSSNSISIEVIKGKQQAATGDTKSLEEQVFVSIEVDTSNAYIGQQILLDYKLYTTVNIANYNIISESTYDGCFVQNIRTFNNRQQREIIDGVQYVTQVLKRVALFPQQNGVINIEPASIQLGINTGQRSGGFFGGYRTKAHYTNTNGIDINVRTLPQGKPITFTGGVGNYKISSSHSNSKVSTDDGVAIKLSIIGTGDMKRVSAPTISSPLAADGSEAFEVYEPTLKNEASYENGGHIEGRKDFEYLLLPKVPGNYLINPVFTYFNPDSSKYLNIETYKFPVSVSQGVGVASNKALTEESIQKDQLKPYIANVSLNTSPSFIVRQPWFLTIWGLPVIAFIGFLGFQQYQSNKGPIDYEALARKKAEKVARKKLEQAEAFMSAKDAKSFYGEISNAYLGYVQDKLRIQTADLSKSTVANHLSDLDVSPGRIEQFVDIMQKTDMALYSGGNSADAMQEFYEQAVEVLITIEQEIQTE